MAGLTGVLGGTFDPPHLGHLTLAQSGIDELELDKVLWVLTRNPPHKPDDPISPLEARQMMLEATIRNHPNFEFSRVDIDRPSPHYAIGTMRALREEDPEAHYAYLIGEDSLRDLPTWHNPAELVELCDMLGVMHRSNVQVDLERLEEVLPGISAKVHFSSVPQMDISASGIRRRVREGLSYEHLVPHAVARIIRDLGLYK